MNPPQKIANLRNEIDKIDNHIVELLLKRFSNAKKIGKVKNMNAMDIDDLRRENYIIETLSNKSDENLKKEDISAIFKLIINISKKLQIK